MHKGLGKSLLVVIAAAMTSNVVYAVAPGFYLGIGAGPATNGAGTKNVQVLNFTSSTPDGYPTQASPNPVVSPANPKSSQFGSRAYLGYKFNQIGSVEMGFTFFSGVNYDLVDSSKQAIAGTTARVRGVDVLGKVDYAFRDTIGIFGKAGVALTYLTTPGALNPTGYSCVPGTAPLCTTGTGGVPPNPIGTKETNAGSNTYTTKAVPAVAIGADYGFNQNLVMDVSWMTYMVGGSVGNMSLISLGLSYHFVDKYCGQFLCDD